MTNTKFRKRALLSSVAMLLVALVALGSATFAWFAANPNAKATGLDMKTTASSGLVIRTDSDATWSHAATLYKDQTDVFDLQPASQSQAATLANSFFQATAAYASAPGGDTNKAVGGVTPSSWAAPSDATTASSGLTTAGSVYSEKVYFKLTTGSASGSHSVNLAGISITGVSGAALQSAIRVSVANSAGTVVGTYGISAPSNKTLGATASAYSTASISFDNAKAASSANETVWSGTLSSAESLDNYCTVYVWLDGEDPVCYSDDVTSVDANKIIDEVVVNFTLS